MLESLKNKPFAIEELPQAVQKPASPDAPKPLRLMAAKGALPIPPDTIIYLWYQLQFDEDEEVRAALKETVSTFDGGQLVIQVQKDLPECLLDWLSKVNTDPRVLEAILLNPKTNDATVMDIAETASRDIVEIIANNHVRILRSPEIIEKIYNNPATRMATVDKLMALAKEHNIELPNLKLVQDALVDAMKDEELGLSDEEFEQVLKNSVDESKKEEAAVEKEEIKQVAVSDYEKVAATDERQAKRLTRSQLIERMNAPQRIRLALMGSREDRTILLRDSRRVVYMSVLKSPKFTLSEAATVAASKSASDEMVSYIAQRREWLRYYPIVVALVNNPKCPMSQSLGLMKMLRTNDLKNLQKSKSVPAQITRQAQALLRQKNSQ